MQQLICKEQDHTCIYHFKPVSTGLAVESETIYELDSIVELHKKTTSRKEKKELADQYAMLAAAYNKYVNFTAFKTSL